MHDLTTIWREISNWPPEQRLELATRLLQSLLRDNGPVPISNERQEALRQLIGIWKTEKPPTEEQVARILEQERMKKHG
jgi:hypothetical protein